MRGQAVGVVSRPGSGSLPPNSIASVMGSQHKLSDTRPGLPLRVNTEVGSALSANHRELSVEAGSRDNVSVLSPTRRYESPISRVRCDGWCGYELNPCATVVSVDSRASWVNEVNNTTNQVSLSACADLQRAWEGPRGSLTVVLCEFLGKLVFH